MSAAAANQAEVTVGDVVQMPARTVRPTRTAAKKTAAVKAAPKTGSGRRATVQLVPKLHKAEMRTIGQFIAAIAASFLPLASYVIAHREAITNQAMWVLVAAALLFSAPTLADWAQKWTRSSTKAWGFTILLEGVMVFSGTEYLGYAGLAILMAINCNSAWQLAGQREPDAAKA